MYADLIMNYSARKIQIERGIVLFLVLCESCPETVGKGGQQVVQGFAEWMIRIFSPVQLLFMHIFKIRHP